MRPEDYANILLGSLREKIRARILEEIEADLSAAVEQAVQELNIVVKSWYDYQQMQATVQVVLADARGKK
jgi:uncharacterized protein YqfA (UPF0365 family)